MATGDSNDILNRVKRLIPNRWFSYVAPLRDAVLGGLSDGTAWCYGWYTFARQQARIATSTGVFLDIIAYDYLGRHLLRSGASDKVFRTQIMSTILQERVTRAGMTSVITKLVGNAPKIFEPWNTGDAGGWSGKSQTVGTFAYGMAGGWGSLQLPGQIFMEVTRAAPSGVAGVAGWGSYPGGYGAGSIEYVGPSITQGGVTNAIIEDAIHLTKPSGVTVWLQIN